MDCWFNCFRLVKRWKWKIIDILLTVVDVFSKYAWARKLKMKTGKEITENFKDILSEGQKPSKIMGW